MKWLQAQSRNEPHIPYRNSKLTHLLRPALSSAGKALMLVNINPETHSAAQSLSALRFAATINPVESGAAVLVRRSAGSRRV